MTIAERNKIALSYTGLIHKIVSEDFKQYEHDDLFQIGFLAVLKAISEHAQDLCAALVSSYIRNNIKWYLINDYRITHFDADKVNDEYIPDSLEDKIDFKQMQITLDKLLRHCLSYSQANLIKLYFGLDGRSRSLADMAQIMHCSREHVHQKIHEALRKLKYGNSNKKKRSIKNDLLKELKTWTEK